MIAGAMIGKCQKCDKVGYIAPLHGEKGGPLFCPFCAGAWNGEHGKKLKWRRIVVRAMRAYQDAGGSIFKEKDHLYLAAAGLQTNCGLDVAGVPTEVPDITSELLADILQLAHPDKHPPERQELAKRVTQDLLALKPYVFAAPKPKPPPVYRASDGSAKTRRWEISKPSKPPYPCAVCVDAIPRDYCNSCRAEWEKKQEEEREQEKKKRIARNALQRRRYAPYKQRPGLTHCSNCAGQFRAKRQDAKYCSALCRQKAYLARGGKPSNDKPLDRTEIDRAIDAVFAAEPEWAFTADELCSRLFPDVPKRKHRNAVLAACKAAGLGILISETRGGTRLVFKLDSLMGYAVARERARFWMLNAGAERIKADLASGGCNHHLVAEGGAWGRHWQMFVAEARGETDTPHYRNLAAEQARVFGKGL